MTPINFLKKAVIFIAGITVIVIGVILLPLPGPGFLIIAFGLFILSTEFAWAERRLASLKSKSKDLLNKTKGKPNKDNR